jgi:hypothetical protein
MAFRRPELGPSNSSPGSIVREWELFEWIKYLDSRTPEIPIVA